MDGKLVRIIIKLNSISDVSVLLLDLLQEYYDLCA